ncbi:carbohydrate kinase family protein [Trabulsiella odontotermitis]|uniref:carbohydrate kinase family protein n=1 Tax=Trabulsiella odontotermitis TaxID=379893 RepID=UPI0006761B68|nr:carbohydrate kinase family protein [Trabulsiella odontotermitis]KNC91870.1 hypothetical protein GM30_21210 [Trabulsiella odontotermitis]
MKTFDVVAVGSGTVDLVFRVPRLPGNDDKVVGKKVAELIGGTVANTACVMGKLGLRVASLSTAGNDYFGQSIVDDFVRNHVDIRFVQRKSGIDANMAVIFLDDSGEKALVYAPNDETETSMVQAQEAISDSRVVYIMPGRLDKFRAISRYAKEKETKIVVDIESHLPDSQQHIHEILSLCDVAIFNKEGFRTSLQQEPERETLEQLVRKHDLDALVVTCGGGGVMACNREKFASHPGYQIPVVDTTGAGDTFNGAFIYCYLNNTDLADALSFASAAAAINISHFGARGKLSTVNDINNFKEKYQ